MLATSYTGLFKTFGVFMDDMQYNSGYERNNVEVYVCVCSFVVFFKCFLFTIRLVLHYVFVLVLHLVNSYYVRIFLTEGMIVRVIFD